MTKPIVVFKLITALLLLSGTTFAQLQITEISSNSNDAFLDEDGDSSDWIEITNIGPTAASLRDHFLSDDPDLLNKWQLPQLSIPAAGSVTIFASGKDRATLPGPLHTNFSLSPEGETLTLTAPDGISALSSIAYPKQFYGISYGPEGYFTNPTPGTPNGTPDYTDYVRDTNFSVTRGFFDSPFAVSISTTTTDAAIYYTTDGSAPSTRNGTLFQAGSAVPIDTTTILRAIATKTGLISSDIDTQTYIFPNQVIHQNPSLRSYPSTWGIDNSTHLGGTGLPRPADYAMDPGVLTQYGEQAVLDGLRHHPTVSLVMSFDSWFNNSTSSRNGGVYSNPYGGTGNQFHSGMGTPREWERAGSVEFIGFPKLNGQQANCGIRIAGNYARHPNRYKHHLRLAFRSEYGPGKLKTPIFSRTDVDTFDNLVLRCGNSESWTFPNNTDRPQVQYLRDQYFKDTQEALGRLSTNLEYVHVYINGLYWGLYTMLERVDANFLAQHLGGNDEDYDAIKVSGTVIDGDAERWNAMFAISRDPANASTRLQEIEEYLDVDNLIDYMIVNFHGGMTDWSKNWRGGGRRGGGDGFKFFCWDSERSLGGPGSPTNTKNITNINNANHASELHQDLAVDSNYQLRFGDRVHELFFNDGPLTPDACIARYNARADEIRPSLISESARWGDRWQPGNPMTIDGAWKTELDSLNASYFPGRSANVLNQFKARNLYPGTVAPVFSQHGGYVDPGAPITISAPTGTIYYTLDGADPRSPSGRINRSSLSATGTAVEVIDSTMIITSRVHSGTEWSALNQATFILGSPASSANLVISEIFYNPIGSDEDTEFIELTNLSAEPVALAGVAFTEGIEFSFPYDAILNPGERLLLVSNQSSFVTSYGDALPVFGTFTNQLKNSGERLTLSGPNNSIIAQIDYQDHSPWPLASDGNGFSLTLIDPSLDPTDPASWRASATLGGSPGESDSSTYSGTTTDELLAYAFTPEQTIQASIETLDDAGAPSRYLVLSVPTRLTADDVVYTIQLSRDLLTWEDGSAIYLGSLEPSDPGLRFWRTPLPVDSSDPYQFARVSASIR